MQGGPVHFVARVPEFAAAMRAVMLPGGNQAEVFKPIETMGECQWLAVQCSLCPFPLATVWPGLPTRHLR